MVDLITLFCSLCLAEIIMFEGLTCVYRSNVDLFFYVVGSAQENEVRAIPFLRKS